MSKHWSDYANTEEDGLTIMRLTAENEKLKRIVEVYEKANEFYGDQKKYYKREVVTDLNQTTAIFKEEYRKRNDLTKPNLHTGYEYECSARIKVDQGKTARQAKEEVERIRKGDEK